MTWKLLAGAFALGALGAGAAVYFAAKRTASDLTGQGAEAQAAFEAAGRMTQRDLQRQADAWARMIAAAGQNQIEVVALVTADEVVAKEYGITPEFIADAAAFQAVVDRTTTNPLAVVRARLGL